MKQLPNDEKAGFLVATWMHWGKEAENICDDDALNVCGTFYVFALCVVNKP